MDGTRVFSTPSFTFTSTPLFNNVCQLYATKSGYEMSLENLTLDGMLEENIQRCAYS